MNKELRNAKKLLKGSEEAYLMVTRNGVGIVGTTPEILAQLTVLIAKLLETEPKEMLEEAIELGLMPMNERIEKLTKNLGEILKKIENIAEKEN